MGIRSISSSLSAPFSEGRNTPGRLGSDSLITTSVVVRVPNISIRYGALNPMTMSDPVNSQGTDSIAWVQ